MESPDKKHPDPTREMWPLRTLLWVVGWTVVVSTVWVSWVRLALSEDLHSHVLLIPVVTIYLLLSEGDRIKPATKGSVVGWVLLAVAVISFFSVWLSGLKWSIVDYLSLQVLIYLIGLWGILIATMGWAWVRSAIFPLSFLVFMIPLPGWLEVALEQGLMTTTAWVCEWVFDLGGIPVFRDGQVLELPGMTLEVAQECSGIRSSFVLFITSVLAAHLFLPTPWRKVLLVLAVWPLGILRNAFRIYVIGWLCVHQGPEMIDSWIHKKGGPVFFAVSLVPLLLLVWLLRRKRPSGIEAEEAV